jgi:hypothetical protein
MVEFKRGLWSLIKSVVVAFITPVFVFFFVLFFVDNYMIPAAIAGAAFIFLFYLALFSERIKFQIENGELRYYKNEKLKNTFVIKETYFRYRIKSTNDGSGTSHDINLYASDMKAPEENEVQIDCSPIGMRKFEKMFDLLSSESDSKPAKLKTKKKEEK